MIAGPQRRAELASRMRQLAEAFDSEFADVGYGLATLETTMLALELAREAYRLCEEDAAPYRADAPDLAPLKPPFLDATRRLSDAVMAVAAFVGEAPPAAGRN